MEEVSSEKAESSPEKAEPKDVEKVEFKKPVLIGRVGKLPKNIKKETERPPEPKEAETSQPEASDQGENSAAKSSAPKSSLPPAVLLKELSTPIPYKEPKWSGLCPDVTQYALEVLKSGMIVDNVDLTKKPYYVFGRLANCDVVMAHPTISRHHCILQYKAFVEEGEPPSGWYLYDLGSTHGTFLNRERLNPGRYVRVRVGHQIRLGASTRTYIVLGPDYDCEGESDLTVTEIKQKALEMKLDRDKLIREAVEERERRKQEEERKRDEQGIDWGMGEDADESADLSVNPFAPGTEAELQLADPKKSLRGYFEREGHELVYQCEERGPGQFLCRVELPLDDALGRPLVAEVLHRGRKKEAVVACALEACRLLERAGALRQPAHESKRRKQRDWAADDFYDSDEDAFLDRTGAIEQKRTRRKRAYGHHAHAHGGREGGGGCAGGKDAAGGGGGKALTYDDLLKQISEIETKISFEEKTLERLRASGGRKRTGQGQGQAQGQGDVSGEGEDDLDAYMAALAQQGMSMATKAQISQTKMSISALQKELAQTRRLADLARPAELPPLAPPPPHPAAPRHKMAVKRAGNDVIYGKRIRLKEDAERRKRPYKETKLQDEGDFVEEVDSDDDTEQLNTDVNKEKEISRIDPPKENNCKTENSKHESLQNERDSAIQSEDASEKDEKPKRMFGPQRPPDNYVIPENYFDQGSDRDLPNIEDTNDTLI